MMMNAWGLGRSTGLEMSMGLLEGKLKCDVISSLDIDCVWRRWLAVVMI